MTKVTLVIGSDNNFTDYLIDCMDSIIASGLLNTAKYEIEFGILNCGIYPSKIPAIRAKYDNVKIIEPDWDYQIKPKQPDWFKAMTARPNLPKWFPQAEVIVWLDADTWVQTAQSLELLIEKAQMHDVAAVEEAHPTYPSTNGNAPHKHVVEDIVARRSIYARYLSLKEVASIANLPMINCGVFAMKSASPVWKKWHWAMKKNLKKAKGDLFFAEQTAFNFVLRQDAIDF